MLKSASARTVHLVGQRTLIPAVLLPVNALFCALGCSELTTALDLVGQRTLIPAVLLPVNALFCALRVLGTNNRARPCGAEDSYTCCAVTSQCIILCLKGARN